MLVEERNTQTQKIPTHPVFNNWDVVAKGWYAICLSSEIKEGQVKSFTINGQHIAVFRDSKKQVHGMDGYCSHMGVDLGIGKVVNDQLRCYFHHWTYDGSGKCTHIPAQKEIPSKACLRSYQVKEKYQMIWVYPEKKADIDILEIPELEGAKVMVRVGESYERSCHYHITMINGIDPQHLSTVHRIHMEMNMDLKKLDDHTIDIQLSGVVPSKTLKEKLSKLIVGTSYGYSMRYQSGCLAALSALKETKLFNRFQIFPTMNMLFSYQMVEPGRTKVYPIFVTKKRSGPHGWLASKVWLFLTEIAFSALQGEDGAVYDNIRFNTGNFLAMDKPITKYIQYINKLTPSCWGRLES